MAQYEEPDPFRDLEEMLDAIIDYGIVKLDVHGKVASWSRGAQVVTGYTADEVIGQPVSIFYTDADKAAGLVEHALETAAASGHFECDGWRLRKGGESFWCRGVNASIHDHVGTLSGFVTVFRDISERRPAELTSARLAAIVRSSDAAIFAIAPDKVVVTWNAAAEDLLGYTEAEIVGNSVEVLIPEKARSEFDISIKRLRAGEHAIRYDSWRRRKDGSWSRSTSAYPRSETRRGSCLVIRRCSMTSPNGDELRKSWQ